MTMMLILQQLFSALSLWWMFSMFFVVALITEIEMISTIDHWLVVFV